MNVLADLIWSATNPNMLFKEGKRKVENYNLLIVIYLGINSC
jgi:hypothetical protein